jgi:hypothetical protein
MTITVGPNGVKSTIQPEVQEAVEAYIDSLPMAAPLPWSRIAQVAYAADQNITNVTLLTLNGGTSDLTTTQGQVIRAGTVVIN